MKKAKANSIYHYFCRDPLQRLCMGRGARVAPPSSFLRTVLSIKPPHLSTVSVSICASFLFLLCILSKICPIVIASSLNTFCLWNFSWEPSLLLDSMRNLHFFISILNKSISYISASFIPPCSSWKSLRSKRKGGWILLYTQSFIHFFIGFVFFFLLALIIPITMPQIIILTSWSIHWTKYLCDHYAYNCSGLMLTLLLFPIIHVLYKHLRHNHLYVINFPSLTQNIESSIWNFYHMRIPPLSCLIVSRRLPSMEQKLNDNEWINENARKLPETVYQLKCYRFNQTNMTLASFTAKDIWRKNVIYLKILNKLYQT